MVYWGNLHHKDCLFSKVGKWPVISSVLILMSNLMNTSVQCNVLAVCNLGVNLLLVI